MSKITSKPPIQTKPTAPAPKAQPAAAAAVPVKSGWGPKTGNTGAQPALTGFDARPTSRAMPKTDADLAQIRELLKGHTDRSEEKKIIDVFKNSSPAELNELIGEMPQHELHELMDDMNDRLFGPDNRTAFLKMISTDRAADLTPASKAKVISTLQYHRTGSADEKAVRDLFLSTKGADLSALKKAIDHGEDHRDLQQMVFHDIDDPKIRGQLLAHFQKEGTVKNGQVKVLSDIDDTFYANLKDDRYPKKTVYPGVKDFYSALDQGGAAKPDEEGDLMFLSARPYDRAGGSEHISRGTIEKAGVQDPTILSGDWAHLVGNELIANKKFDNWAQVRQLQPEYGSVFVGDSGQGDAIFGARAAALPGTDMKKVFIHNVTGLDDAAKADFARKGVFVFDTYVGAAVEAFKSGLISKDNLQKVAAGAERELSEVRFASPEQKAAREAELARDLAAMRAVL